MHALSKIFFSHQWVDLNTVQYNCVICYLETLILCNFQSDLPVLAELCEVHTCLFFVFVNWTGNEVDLNRRVPFLMQF